MHVPCVYTCVGVSDWPFSSPSSIKNQATQTSLTHWPIIMINRSRKLRCTVGAIKDTLRVEVHKWISTNPTDIELKMLKVHLSKHLALRHQDKDLPVHLQGQCLYKACWVRIKLAGGGEIKLKECGTLQNVTKRE